MYGLQLVTKVLRVPPRTLPDLNSQHFGHPTEVLGLVDSGKRGEEVCEDGGEFRVEGVGGGPEAVFVGVCQMSNYGIRVRGGDYLRVSSGGR